MNKPEWFFIFVGCLTSVICGAALPVYGLVFGDIIGVRGSYYRGYFLVKVIKLGISRSRRCLCSVAK